MSRWSSLLARAGAAYAAIIFSIVGINVPTGDAIVSKKVAESPSPADKATEPRQFPS